LEQNGGFVNPYTFVPTLPRGDLAVGAQGGVADDQSTGLGDCGTAGPPSHARHGAGQWSGTISFTLTTITPLLLPVLADSPEGPPKVFDVRVDPDGRPLIHGASLKGALRSAFETITASRYGVFFEHDQRLAHRIPAGDALGLTPARVEVLDGAPVFRLCRGDDAWKQSREPSNDVQDAAWVPTYNGQGRLLTRIGRRRSNELTNHHEASVCARVVLFQYEKKQTRFRVWRATHLAADRADLDDHLRSKAPAAATPSGSLTPVPGVEARIVEGWLSATGWSIGSKHDERLFVRTDADKTIRVEDSHREFWKSVLSAYDTASGYNGPADTYPEAQRQAGAKKEIVRSRHVPSTKELQDLPEGTLVYVTVDGGEITQVHPVMIGRMPYDSSPADLLHESLRPAKTRAELSPADRVFGWVPADGAQTDGNTGSSGYRGRLSVRQIQCTTDDWRPESFPSEDSKVGVVLAPLSTPKPTQYRFYASPDAATGEPMARSATKAEGYAAGGALRGRKMYRWRQEDPSYWQPKSATREANDPQEYLALAEQRKKEKQVSRHRSWVRPGVTFEVTLFVDGVPEAELGALLWLLTRGDDAPLRLGAGKPYGFGVVRAGLDLDVTRLWDADGVAEGWRSLTRPDPAGPDLLTGLAARFEEVALAHPVLAEAVTSYLAAAAPVAAPVHYPRPATAPVPENYLWFKENDTVARRQIKEGWALPHVRAEEQRLPYLEPQNPGPRKGNGGQRRPGR
jgi:CRISPR-associated protein (TIGR03986 family)